MFLSSVVDTLNFEPLKEREIFLMKIRTLQCEIQQLKIQTMIEISKKKHCLSIGNVLQKRNSRRKSRICVTCS